MTWFYIGYGVFRVIDDLLLYMHYIFTIKLASHFENIEDVSSSESKYV